MLNKILHKYVIKYIYGLLKYLKNGKKDKIINTQNKIMQKITIKYSDMKKLINKSKVNLILYYQRFHESTKKSCR